MRISQDLRFALRQLRKSPAFAVTAILTLALGIGANTAIFSVMNAVVLRTLPVRNAGQLVYLRPTGMPDGTTSTGDSTWSVSEGVFEQLRRDNASFSDVMTFVPLSLSKVAVRIGDQPYEANGDMVSGNFFSGLEVNMARGQAFGMEEEKSHAQVAVLSDAYWSTRFGRNPSAIGQTLFVRGVPFTIIGVTAPGFQGVDRAVATDFWIPLQNRPELGAWGMSAANGESLYGTPKWWCVMMIARLRHGVTAAQAQAQATPAFQAAAYAPVGQPKPGVKKVELTVQPARGIAGANEYYQKPLTLLMSMVGLVLAIVCSNIAMLLVARNATRQREFSLRMALGAQRWPLFRQLLTESLLLVGAGAGLGWLFSLAATRALARWSMLDMDLSPDSTVLLFSLGISLLAALVFGLAPLAGALRVPVGMVLTASTSRSTQNREKALAGRVVVTLQMALCVVLLTIAGLLLHSLRNYQNHDVGVRLKGLLVFGISPQNMHSNAQTLQFYQTLVARLRTVPGVESATVMENRLGGGWSDNNQVMVDGKLPRESNGFVRTNSVGTDFFHVLGIPLLNGREFTDADTLASQKVAIVNETFAKRYLPGVNPIGHRMGGSKPEDQQVIVGVVRDSRYSGVDEGTMPMAWYAFNQQTGAGDGHIELHTWGDAEALLPTVRRVVEQIDPNLPLQKPMTQRAQFDESYSDQAMFSHLATFFGLLAALLVAIGLYGTLAYRVSRRTMEIGVRMALGAHRQRVLWMFLRESAWLAAMGIVIGLPAAFFIARLLESMLFGVSVHDPLSFAGALLGVLVVAALAAWLPARRAASVDPMQALRME
jgi:predicted permease